MRTFKHQYIDGRWQPAGGVGCARPLINPATEQVVAIIGMASPSDVEHAIRAACRAQAAFATTTLRERISLIECIVAVYVRRFDELALAITTETGAPYEQSAKRRQARAGLQHLQTALAMPSSFRPEAVAQGGMPRTTPASVHALITPRHDAVAHLLRKLVAALLAACTVVIKPSGHAPWSAQLLAEIVHEVGVPAGVFNLVFGSGPEIGAQLTTHPHIDRVSFTGSAAAAARVACKVASTLKTLSLTICRRSVDLMLADAVSDELVRRSVLAAMHHDGPGSIAAARLLVPSSRLDEVAALAVELTGQLRVGDPLDARTSVGPMSSTDHFQRVQELIATRIAQGATLLTGGLGRPRGLYQGYYARPTVFTAGHELVREARVDETGPLLTIVPYRDEDEAIAIANETAAAGTCRIWSGDAPRAQAVARRVRASAVLFSDKAADAQPTPESLQWELVNASHEQRVTDFTLHETVITTSGTLTRAAPFSTRSQP